MERIRTWFKDMRARSWFVALLTGVNLLFWVIPKLSRLGMWFAVLPFALILLTLQLVKREIRWNAYTINLFAMAVFYILAWVRNPDFSYRALYPLILSCICMTVVGIVPKNDSGRAFRAGTLAIAAITLALMTLLSVMGTISVFTGRQLRFLWKQAYVGVQYSGVPGSRLFLLFSSNAAAALCVLSIMFVVYWLYNRPAPWLKVVLACAIVPLTISLIHCQSRGNNIALAAGLGALAFRALYLRGFRGKKRIWVALAAWAIVFFCMLALFNVIFKIDMHIASAFMKKEEVSSSESRSVTSGTFDMLGSGRGALWRNGIHYLLSHPSKLLLGMGAGDTVPAMRVEIPEMEAVTHLHNAFLETLARGGIPMLLSALAMLAMLVKPCLTLLVAQEAEEDRGLHVLVIMIGMLLLMSMVEVGLFSYANIRNILFFYFSARVMQACAPAGAPGLKSGK